MNSIDFKSKWFNSELPSELIEDFDKILNNYDLMKTALNEISREPSELKFEYKIIWQRDYYKQKATKILNMVLKTEEEIN